MTARIGRAYSRAGASKAANEGAVHFVDPRARLRARLGTALIVLAWVAALVGLVATFWSIL